MNFELQYWRIIFKIFQNTSIATINISSNSNEILIRIELLLFAKNNLLNKTLQKKIIQ